MTRGASSILAQRIMMGSWRRSTPRRVSGWRPGQGELDLGLAAMASARLAHPHGRGPATTPPPRRTSAHQMNQAVRTNLQESGFPQRSGARLPAITSSAAAAIDRWLLARDGRPSGRTAGETQPRPDMQGIALHDGCHRYGRGLARRQPGLPADLVTCIDAGSPWCDASRGGG